MLELEKILELSEAATPGPWWRADPPWGDGTSVHAGPSDDPHAATKVICEFDPFDVQFSPRYDGVDSDKIVEFDNVPDDMAFIAAAREHLPELARTVKLAAELVAGIKLVTTQLPAGTSSTWVGLECMPELRSLLGLGEKGE